MRDGSSVLTEDLRVIVNDPASPAGWKDMGWEAPRWPEGSG